MNVRSEELKDYLIVHNLNTQAFGSEAEANLVDGLRQHAKPYVSLVYEKDSKVVGHIMFSPVTLTGNAALKIMGLAPVAVDPEWQKQGIGHELIKAGLAKCKELGYLACVVLGHPEYYPKFGFVPSKVFNIKSEYDVPDEVFMVLELEDGYLSHAEGVIQYHPEFGKI